MDLRQMEYFVALAEESQFTRAAEITRVSQSGLSAAIKSLEEDLNAKLFVRTTRRVELTPAGRALFPHARNLLAEATAGRDAVTATIGEVTGLIARRRRTVPWFDQCARTRRALPPQAPRSGDHIHTSGNGRPAEPHARR